MAGAGGNHGPQPCYGVPVRAEEDTEGGAASCARAITPKWTTPPMQEGVKDTFRLCPASCNCFYILIFFAIVPTVSLCRSRFRYGLCRYGGCLSRRWDRRRRHAPLLKLRGSEKAWERMTE